MTGLLGGLELEIIRDPRERYKHPDGLPNFMSWRNRLNRRTPPYSRYRLHDPLAPTTPASAGEVYARISRLPTEILVHIFSLYSDAFASVAPGFRKPPCEFDVELDRLANVRLLTCSRVCGQWYHIFMNTSKLWSTFELDGVLWDTPLGLEKTLLLAAGWERTRNASIEARIFDEMDERPLPSRVFELLAQHSSQWRTAEFSCFMGSLDLSILKGSLPILQRLELNLPRIVLPHALAGLGCERVALVDVAHAVYLATELPRGAHFRLTTHIDTFRAAIPPPRTSVSAISQLSCRLLGGQSRSQRPSHDLTHIFMSLTSPYLEELSLTGAEYPNTISDWPHAQFLGFAERSGFHRSLKILRIAEVLITAEDLLEILSSLETLEHLEIADKRHANGMGAEHVVSDNFLINLADPDCRLVPRLRSFACVTRLQFTNEVFVAFVASRVEGCSSGKFHVKIRSLTGDKGAQGRASLPALLHKLQEQCNRRLECDVVTYRSQEAGIGFI
ncbi:hypothetical protein MVEN_01489700 [Mycena venus]|uniref:F-box domain-containing protein n=1 Tax=Mycena venus TaxID=2733690 RepID=A0A8H6XSM3_9AGAR|nr:hypothetical protein MVEN_01489700 [Mycena venus]